MSEKISLGELRKKMTDLSIPEQDLAQYFVADKDRSRPFAPALRPNPARVDLTPTETLLSLGAPFMDWANCLCRWRRKELCRWRRENGSTLPLLVSEGDSWFQFPLLLNDLIDHISADGTQIPQPPDKYDVWCVGAAGDTLANMVDDITAEYPGALKNNKNCRVLLFSAAGNDFVGEDPDGSSVLYKVIKDYEAGRTADYYLDTPAFRERLDFIERGYRKLLTTVRDEFPEVTVVIHGYDYAIPYSAAPRDPRNPIWAERDAWLGKPLKLRGFPQEEMWSVGKEIVVMMIDKLNEMQIELCRNFPNSRHVDFRGTLTNVNDWADELHPTSKGFKKIAKKLAPTIREVLKTPPQPLNVASAMAT